MLGYFAASLMGSSHQFEENGVCQDAHSVKLLNSGWIVAAIADGLGSSKHSDVASSVAVNAATEYLSSNAPVEWNNEEIKALLRKAFDSSLTAVTQEAGDNSLKEYETTLTLLMYDGQNVAYGSVGDGGIIALTSDGDYLLLNTPMKGEVFNETIPLHYGSSFWEIGHTDKTICSLLMLTDGIFDVAYPWLLSKQKQKIYVNYVRPFMDRNILPVNNHDDFRQVEQESIDYFKQVEEITDDKTFVGIINTDFLPSLKEKSYYDEPDWVKLHDEAVNHSEPVE